MRSVDQIWMCNWCRIMWCVYICLALLVILGPIQAQKVNKWNVILTVCYYSIASAYLYCIWLHCFWYTKNLYKWMNTVNSEGVKNVTTFDFKRLIENLKKKKKENKVYRKPILLAFALCAFWNLRLFYVCSCKKVKRPRSVIPCWFHKTPNYYSSIAILWICHSIEPHLRFKRTYLFYWVMNEFNNEWKELKKKKKNLNHHLLKLHFDKKLLF